MADYLLYYSISKPLQIFKKDNRRSKFVRVVFYIVKGIWISIRLKMFMKGSLQVVFDKADKQEFIIVAKSEVDEKIRLKVT